MKHLNTKLISLIALLFLLQNFVTGQVVGSTISIVPIPPDNSVKQLTLKLFRDCAGLQLCGGCATGTSPVPCNMAFAISGGAMPTGINHNIPASSLNFVNTSFGTLGLSVVPGISGLDVTQSCSTSICRNCNTRTPGPATPGIEVYTFSGVLNLTNLPAGACWISLSSTHGLRKPNSPILNNSGGLQFYTEAFINRCVIDKNSSPQFYPSTTPFTVCAGQDSYYPLKFKDEDNDSLSFRLGSVLSAPATTAPYNSPYSPQAPFPHLGLGLPANPPVGIHLDAEKGMLRFRTLGAFIAPLVIEVLEWRKINGVVTLIGLTRYEMEVQSIVCPTTPPAIDIYNEQTLEDGSKTTWNICDQSVNPVCFIAKSRATNVPISQTYIWADSFPGVSITKFPQKSDSMRICITQYINDTNNIKPLVLNLLATESTCPQFSYGGRTMTIIKSPKPAQTVIIGSEGNFKRKMQLQALNSVPINAAKTIWKIEALPASNQFFTKDTGSICTYQFPLPGIYKIITIIEGVCTVSLSHIIEVKDFAIKDSILSHIACKGQNTGKVLAVIKGPIGPVQYKINNGPYQSNPLFENLVAGTFKLYAKDSFNQIDSILFTLTEPALAIYVNTTLNNHPSCHKDSNGTIQILAGGGIPPYVFGLNQNTPSSNNTFNNLPAGKYLVKVMDQNNCIKYSDTITLNNPTPLEITFNTLPDSCNQIAVGKVTATVSGGMPNYTYSWLKNPAINLPVLSGLRPEKYPLKATDSKGCTKIDTATVALANLVGSEQICAINVPIPSQYKQEIIWNKTLGKRIANYQIWVALNDTSPFTLKATIPAQSSSVYIDSTDYLFLESKQYKLLYIDSCARTSIFSNVASPIKFSLEALSYPKLSWSMPQMNSTVTEFQIFRKGSSGVFNIIKTLSPSHNQYIDSFYVGQGLNFEYYVSASLTNNCQISHINSYIKTFTVLGLNKQLSNASGFTLYPNPAQHSVTVKSLHKQSFTNIEIRSIEGKLIESYTFQQPQDEAQLQLPQLSKGLYHLFISSEGKTGITLPLMISY